MNVWYERDDNITRAEAVNEQQIGTGRSPVTERAEQEILWPTKDGRRGATAVSRKRAASGAYTNHTHYKKNIKKDRNIVIGRYMKDT